MALWGNLGAYVVVVVMVAKVATVAVSVVVVWTTVKDS